MIRSIDDWIDSISKYGQTADPVQETFVWNLERLTENLLSDTINLAKWCTGNVIPENLDREFRRLQTRIRFVTEEIYTEIAKGN